MHQDASTRSGYDDATVDGLLEAMLECLPRRRGAALVGLSGLQGSGKSTLARQIAAAARTRGIWIEILSLDDFYFGRSARAALAREVHPLLATRGVPGTHDLALLDQTLRALRNATPRHPARVPRFDKGRDTRVPPSRWRRVARTPRLILLEGWCIGVPPQRARELVLPVNAIERRDDAKGAWRSWVNAQLAGDYARLWRKLDALILLAAPNFAIIERWRGEAERELLRRNAPLAMPAPTLRRFLMHYERLSRHMLRALPAIADIVITLDENRRVRGIRIARRSR
ncbi:MAG TPA: kinase [Rhodanobacteraceae bacterium]|jgi:D-glycerate 3-kinase|nr:kinase [Rhodanobacteraceae bacterium]